MKGVNPAWANLPRRKCDDCGKNYKPKQPLRKDTRGFCSDNCRKSYHKHGGAYRKLRGEMQKMVIKHLAAINDANQTELRILVEKELDRINAELKELRQLWSDTETRVVNLAVVIQDQQYGNPRRKIAEAISKSLSPAPEESNAAPLPNRSPRA